MSKKKPKLPPEWLIVPNARRHVHRVAIVRQRDAMNRPCLVEIQHDQDKPINVADPANRDIITMYVPEVITQIKDDER